MRGIKWGIILSVCMILMFSYGCSKGSGSRSYSSTSSSLSAYSYYKFYLDYNSSTLYAVDPSNPTSPIYVSTIDKFNDYSYSTLPPSYGTIPGYQYNASNYTISNVHDSYIIYSKNGLIYKLPTEINAGLTPVQVSNLNATICSLQDETENVDSDLDFISVETAGADGVCYGYCATTSTYYSDDNQYYQVRLGMSSSDSPIAVPQNYYMMGGYLNYSTGNIGGLFIDNNGTYEACDDNLTNCINLNATDIYVIGDYPGKVYLRVNATEIYSFDKTSKALAWIYTSPYELDCFTQDGDNIYFSSNSTICKLDTTSNSVTSLYTDTSPVYTIHLTDDKIVYGTSRAVYTTSSYGYPYYDYSVYSIKILDKTGGTPTTIYSFNSTSPPNPNLVTTDDKIVIPYNNATLIYDENGNLLQTFNATIIAIQWSNSGSLLRDEWPPVKILIDNNVTSTLNAISLSDLSNTIMAQPLPTDILRWRWYVSYSNIFLLTGDTNISYPSGDVFFLDTSKANSFIRVTNTPDDEFCIWLW